MPLGLEKLRIWQGFTLPYLSTFRQVRVVRFEKITRRAQNAADYGTVIRLQTEKSEPLQKNRVRPSAGAPDD